jgi:hypothetical protein
MSSSDRKSYCKKKNSSGGRRVKRITSKIRKNKAKKSAKRQKANQSKARKHWKNTYGKAKKMCSNFATNASTLAVPNPGVKGEFDFDNSDQIFVYLILNFSC